MIQPKVKYAYASVDWAFMRFMDILDADNPDYVYLRRFILVKTPWFAIYVHFIYTPDNDRDPHNHPMPFLSMVLKGGYVEQRTLTDGKVDNICVHAIKKRLRTRWSIARTVRSDFHSIMLLEAKPTITLLLVGPRHPQGWGFLTTDGYVDQEAYIREKEERWRTKASQN